MRRSPHARGARGTGPPRTACVAGPAAAASPFLAATSPCIAATAQPAAAFATAALATASASIATASVALAATTLALPSASALAASSLPIAAPARAVAAAARATCAFDTAAVASARRLRLPGLLHQQRVDDALPRRRVLRRPDECLRWAGTMVQADGGEGRPSPHPGW